MRVQGVSEMTRLDHMKLSQGDLVRNLMTGALLLIIENNQAAHLVTGIVHPVSWYDDPYEVVTNQYEVRRIEK